MKGMVREMINIGIDSNAQKHLFCRHWQFGIGSGHAALALRSDYITLLKKVREELGITYVRFHGIFNEDMDVVRSLKDILPIRGAERFVEYNFEKIGTAYDNILSCSMKPFVELSFMPELLAGGSTNSGLFYRPNITPPADYEQWGRFIERFIRYLTGRYGIEEVADWYFEVWNEPDLGVFFDGKKEDYFKLYEVTVRAVKTVDERLRVGGPATSASKWIGSFLEYCRVNHTPLDFVSTHQYAGDPIGGIQGGADLEAENEKVNLDFLKETDILVNPPQGTILEGFRQIMQDRSELVELPRDSFRKNAAATARMVKQQGSLTLFYTEWNANAIFSASTNDTRKAAAYDVKAALDTELTIDASCVWCFSDLFEEFHHFQEEFHGGFGLLTSHGIPKPVYHAFVLLKEVGAYRLELEDDATDREIGAAAFTEERTVWVLLFRQKMKQSQLPPEPFVVEIKTDELPEALTVKKIDEFHGNPLKVWQELGAPVPASEEQVEKIKKESEVRGEVLDYVFEDGIVTFEGELSVNDVWLVRLDVAAGERCET